MQRGQSLVVQREVELVETTLCRNNRACGNEATHLVLIAEGVALQMCEPCIIVQDLDRYPVRRVQREETDRS